MNSFFSRNRGKKSILEGLPTELAGEIEAELKEHFADELFFRGCDN